MGDEVLKLARQTGKIDTTILGSSWRIDDLLQAGDFVAADQQFVTSSKLARAARQPVYLWFEAFYLAMRATLEGRLDEAEPLCQQALSLGQRVGEQAALQLFGAQMLVLRWEQGRLPEIETVFSNFVAAFPAVPAFRSGRALVYAELGRLEEARADFDLQAGDEFSSVQRDRGWLTALSCLAQVCVSLGDAAQAEVLHELLRPFDGRCVILLGALYLGPVSHYLGLLATTLERWDEAERHFADAIAKNKEIGARPRLARAQYDYAGMLLSRDGSGDREKALDLLAKALDAAHEMGMKALIDRGLALKLELQGDSD